MKKQVKRFLITLRNFIFNEQKNLRKLVIITNDSNESNRKYEEVKLRLKYFDPSIEVSRSLKGLSLKNKLNTKMIGFIDCEPSKLVLKIKEGLLFNLDYETNYEDGWEYHRILTKINQRNIVKNRPVIEEKLLSIRKELRQLYDKTYIFGTGPSLAKASERSWDDGIRVVSNTIVKDKELWHHINPHFIVAGDAIYHYGISEFAQAFRKDLADRLSETNTYFVFQEHFLPFIKNMLPLHHDRLIPIPVVDGKNFSDIIETKFELPGVGNVLNSLLLPLASYLTDNIGLWGFDGRAPTDKLFWKNSDKHFYSDLVPQLQKLHPAFYQTLVPKDNPEKYVQSVHGDVLNNMLTEAEGKGKVFSMLHETYTETLKARYPKDGK
jgi:hypothetical protein